MSSTPAPASPERYCPTCERSFVGDALQLCPADRTELVTIGGRPDPLLGASLGGRYTIEARLGAGGMGTVYRGTQHSVGRDVAIKVVSPALVTAPDAIKRFLREAKLSSRLAHPNAVAVLDFGQTPDGLFYLVMELLEGRTLDRVIADTGRVPLGRLVRIADQICDALEGAHRLAIIHRDLKPSNVMLLAGSDDRDLVKVLDFGLAKSLSVDTTSTSMTGSGALLGTPAYMSPEAALGDPLDARCDLYSLGVMLYVLASGRLPFQSTSVRELIAMQASAAPPPLTVVPAPVAAVIMRLIAKAPDDRYASAAATRAAFARAVLEARTSPAAIETTLPQLAPVSVSAATLASGPVAVARDSVAVASDRTRAPVARATTLPPVAVPPRGARRWRVPAILGALAVAAVAVIVTRGSARSAHLEQMPSATTAPAPEASRVAPPMRSSEPAVALPPVPASAPPAVPAAPAQPARTTAGTTPSTPGRPTRPMTVARPAAPTPVTSPAPVTSPPVDAGLVASPPEPPPEPPPPTAAPPRPSKGKTPF